MNLGKPPIVQAWIEFRFDRAAESPEWGIPTANAFFDQFQNAYPEREMLFEQQFKIQKVEKNQRSSVVDEKVSLVGMRVFTTGKQRCVQLIQDTLTCNFSTQAGPYDGFEALKTEALTKFRAYVDFFRPAKLNQAAIHYVDLVRIPFQNGQVVLADYFTFARDLPDQTFGTTLGFNVTYGARPPQSKDFLEVRLYNEQTDPEGPTAQFRMDWRLIASDGISFAESELGERLNEAHATLLGCFRNSFTDKGWGLFEPIS